MNAIVNAINAGGIASYPRNYIWKKLGLVKVNTGWEFLRLKYAKHFGFGIEVRGKSPDFKNIEEMHERARESMDLALKHYGDMLIEADIQVKEGTLREEQNLVEGYQIDFSLPWDFTKPTLIEIIYDRKSGSYRILGVVYNHIIDGVPLALYIYLIHNHLVLGERSFLRESRRTYAEPYRFHLNAALPILDKDKWMEVSYSDDETLIPVGAQVDITKSAIPRLRKKISRDIGENISTSSLEIALLSIEMGMTWVTDYIAQGHLNEKKRLDAQRGYRGLGIVRMHVDETVKNTEPREQYRWLCDNLSDAHRETGLERMARGRATLFYDRYSRIDQVFIDFFDKRVSYDSVMSVAGTQLIGSNLNGVDYGVPLFVGGIVQDDVRFIFIPSHGEHNKETRIERAKRSLETHVTEVSFSCGPKISLNNGRSIVYKSLKLSPRKAYELLLRWDRATEYIRSLSPSERVRQVFIETYSPDSPVQGRIEGLAERFLKMD